MKSSRASTVLLLLASFCLFASGQRAAHYTRLGFAPKPTKHQKVQVHNPAHNGPQDTSPPPAGHWQPALKPAPPQPYAITFQLVNEWNAPLAGYPAVKYTFLVQKDLKTRVVKASQLVKPDEKGKAVVTCTVQVPANPAYITFELPTQSVDDPEWAFAVPQEVAFTLPAAKAAPKKRKAGDSGKAEAIECAAPPIRLKRNRVDLALQGVPPGAKLYIGDEEVRTDMRADTARFVVARQTAVNDDFQINVRFKDKYLERDALIDAATLLKVNGGSISPYRENILTIPDNDWNIVRVGFEGIALEPLKPALGTAEEIGLYSEQQVLDVLGAPERTEPSFAFSKPDGSQWLHFPGKGTKVRVRELYGPGNRRSRAVELVELTGPAGGQVGGVAVGDPASILLSRFGKGATSQRLGKPRVGFHSFLSEGLVFNLDSESTKVESIEIWRPFQLLADAVEPMPMDLPNRLCISPPGSISDDVISGRRGAELAKALSKMNTRFRDRLGSTKSVRIVDSTEAADCTASWRVTGLQAESAGTVYRGTVEIELTLTSKDGLKTVKLPPAKASVNMIGGDGMDELSRKLYEGLAYPVCEAVASEFNFLNRVRSIDYSDGTLALDFGSECGLTAGVVFELLNLESEAFPDGLSFNALRTQLGTKEIDREAGAKLVLIVKSVEQDTASARLAVLFKQRGPAGQGFIDRIVELDEVDWRPQIGRLLDPATGFLFVRLRPVFDMATSENSP